MYYDPIRPGPPKKGVQTVDSQSARLPQPCPDFYRSRSGQFGRTSAPTAPHLVQTIRDPNDGTSI
jgi:hypothetical protein